MWPVPPAGELQRESERLLVRAQPAARADGAERAAATLVLPPRLDAGAGSRALLCALRGRLLRGGRAPAALLRGA